jgi:hypothetical protein
MLTPEEKQRIEDEEKRRIAEEQYRAEVRARLQQPATSRTNTFRGHGWMLILAVISIAVVATALIVLNTRRNTESESASGASRRVGTPSAPSVRYIPVNQKIASGQVVVKARNYVLYNIEIQPNMRDAHISGTYTAAGGSGNDVAAVIATQSQFTNWINGHQARVFYGSEGRKTTDTFDVRLGPGLYCFAISNTFALLSDKYVALDVNLTYQKMETD